MSTALTISEQQSPEAPVDLAAARASPGANRILAPRLIGFATLAMPLAAVEVPLSTYLPPLYASAFGFPLATIGLVFLLARLWDAFIDPAIGTLSDQTRTRFGRRRPWIAVGGLVFAVGAVPVFAPPAAFGPLGLGAALFVLYLGYSMMATPFSAWAGELSSHYHGRTRVASYQQSMTSIALLLALVLPSLVNQRYAAQPRIQLLSMGAMVALLLLPSLLIGLNVVPEPAPGPRPRTRTGIGRTLRLVLGDRLLLRVLASNFAVRVGQGTRTALFVFFVSHYMGIPQWAPQLFLLQFIFGIAASPIWLAIGRRLGKSQAAVAGELLQAAINAGLLLLAPTSVGLLILLTVAQGLSQGSGNLMLRAIVADVADHHRLETGQDRIGLFYSVFSLSDKAAFAVAVGIALPLVAWLGFDPRGSNSDTVLSELKIVFALAPATAHIVSAWLIRGFPLNEHAHAVVRRAIDAREQWPTI